LAGMPKSREWAEKFEETVVSTVKRRRKEEEE
jgi:hypothetical protein